MEEYLVEFERQLRAKKPPKPEMSYHLMAEDIPCICRRGDVPSDEETPPAPVRSPGIFERIKRLFQQS